ncbi:16170_t:CDS:2, partial [Gigaspora rosea]
VLLFIGDFGVTAFWNRHLLELAFIGDIVAAFWNHYLLESALLGDSVCW